ncbi:MAG: PcfB family protein [Oscillospiraceae bacterium]|nr:PcfB family protein [Oscillospiraceae bacterium]
MQEEVNEKTIALCIKGGKITADILKAALRKYLQEMEKEKAKSQQKSQAKKEQKTQVVKRGKQSIKSMLDKGSELSNIEITDNNIRSFERVARKYGIDYSLKRDKSTDPPKYLVFFRAKDADVMTAAFKEYSGITLQKSKRKSIKLRLQKAIEKAAKHREREKTQQKDRGQSL